MDLNVEEHLYNGLQISQAPLGRLKSEAEQLLRKDNKEA